MTPRSSLFAIRYTFSNDRSIGLASLRRSHVAGITADPTGTRTARANTLAERWVRTVRHELLDQTLIWNQRQLRRLLEDFVQHYDEHRPHRNLNQRAPADIAEASVPNLGHPIQHTTTCAGLVNAPQPPPLTPRSHNEPDQHP